MQVYLSCTGDLEPMAKDLEISLRSYDIAAVRAERTLDLADRMRETRNRLIATEAVIFLIGPERDSWVEFEWSAAFEDSWNKPEKKLLPVVLKPATVPSFLLDRKQIAIRDCVRDLPRVNEALKSAILGDGPAGMQTAESAVQLAQQRLQVLEQQSATLQPTPESIEQRAKTLEPVLAKQLENDNHQEAAKSASKLADLMKELKKPEESLNYQQVALHALEKASPDNHPDRARIHSSMASTLSGLGRHDEAIAHAERATAYLRGSKGDDTMAVAVAEMSLSTLLDKAGRAEEAKKHRSASGRAMAKAAIQTWGNIPFVGRIVKGIAEGLLAPNPDKNPAVGHQVETAVEFSKPRPPAGGGKPTGKKPVHKTAPARKTAPKAAARAGAARKTKTTPTAKKKAQSVKLLKNR